MAGSYSPLVPEVDGRNRAARGIIRIVTAIQRHGRVVLLDRDGAWWSTWATWMTPKAWNSCRARRRGLGLYAQGYRLVVITNQSGIGRGLFPIERMHEMNERLKTMVSEAGAKLEGIYFCHHAGDVCECRKPAAGLVDAAATGSKFDPAQAVVIGDKDSDVECGRRAGAATVPIRREKQWAARASRQMRSRRTLLRHACAVYALRALRADRCCNNKSSAGADRRLADPAWLAATLVDEELLAK